MEREPIGEHYSNKGSHFRIGQAHKVARKIEKLEGFSVPFSEIQFTQRRFMRRTPQSGKHERNS